MGNTRKIVREGVPYRKLLHPALSYSVMGHYEIRKAKLSDAGAVRTGSQDVLLPASCRYTSRRQIPLSMSAALRHTLAGSPSERKQAHLVESQASKLTF